MVFCNQCICYYVKLNSNLFLQLKLSTLNILRNSVPRWPISKPPLIGPVAQRITRLTTDQKIPGSNPGRIETFFFFF